MRNAERTCIAAQTREAIEQRLIGRARENEREQRIFLSVIGAVGWRLSGTFDRFRPVYVIRNRRTEIMLAPARTMRTVATTRPARAIPSSNPFEKP